MLINPTITPIKAFSDNYIWLINDSKQAETICVDPGDARPVIEHLSKHNQQLTSILITHHHPDHIGGVEKLLARYPDCFIYGPTDSRINSITHAVKEDQIISIEGLDLKFKILETPGHTLSHVCYIAVNTATPILFCGDTLFSGGCGRLFEGSPAQMLSSLKKLAQLRPNTQIYCAHEYTRNNLAFYLSIMPDNIAVKNYLAELNNQPSLISLPSTIEIELNINPFLNCHSIELQNTFSHLLDNVDELSLFSYIRKLKDSF